MKTKFRIIFLLILLIIPIRVGALTGGFGIECNKTVLSPGETTECTISYVVSSGSLNGFSGTVSTGNNLSLVSSSVNGIWNGTAVKGQFELYTDVPKNKTVPLGSITIKASSNANGLNENIKIDSIVLTDENYADVRPNGYNKTVRIASTEASLSSLSLNGEKISPNFSEDVFSYTVNTTNNQVTVSATAKAGTVSGTGVKKLNYGSNKIEVIVTAEAGNTKTYVINVNRKDTRSSDNTLKNIILDTGTIKFNPNTTTYNISVDSDVTSIKVDAIPNYSKASVTYSPSNKINLNPGNNTININVKAENESTKKYTIIINRKVDEEVVLSDVNTFEKLTIDDYDFIFDSYTNEYSIEVPSDVNELKFDYVLTDDKSTVTINGNKDLVIGENIIEIIVTSESNKENKYIFKVNKLSDEVDSPNDDLPTDNIQQSTEELSNKNYIVLIIMLLMFIVIVVLSIILINEKRKIKRLT